MSRSLINDKDRKQIGEALHTLDDGLKVLGSTGVREIVSGLDAHDHLWLAIEVMCLPQHQRDVLVRTLLRFESIEVVPLIDGTVLLRSGLDDDALDFQSDASVVGAMQRTRIKPSRARRQAIQRDRLFAASRARL